MENSLNIPIKIMREQAKCPKFAYEGDAGFDLCSCIDTKINPMERCLIPCGFGIALPKNTCGLIMPRSGLAYKHGISVVNSPGLIDSGYRGEICVVLINTDKENSFEISIGDKIAQMVIAPYFYSNFNIVEDLEESQRQNKGFGSSGLKS